MAVLDRGEPRSHVIRHWVAAARFAALSKSPSPSTRHTVTHMSIVHAAPVRCLLPLAPHRQRRDTPVIVHAAAVTVLRSATLAAMAMPRPSPAHQGVACSSPCSPSLATVSLSTSPTSSPATTCSTSAHAPPSRWPCQRRRKVFDELTRPDGFTEDQIFEDIVRTEPDGFDLAHARRHRRSPPTPRRRRLPGRAAPTPWPAAARASSASASAASSTSGSASPCRRSTPTTSRRSRWRRPNARCASSYWRCRSASIVTVLLAALGGRVDQPPPAPPAAPGGRRRPARSPPAASTLGSRRDRPRPRAAGPLVQRHGRRRAGPHRARGALRLRRQPRAALADHRAVGGGRGARSPARRHRPSAPSQALDVVVSQVERFDAMVLDLLELSRIDAGAADVHLETVDVARLCREIAGRYGFAELPVVVDDGPRRRASRSIAVRFERILANLLQNAEVARRWTGAHRHRVDGARVGRHRRRGRRSRRRRERARARSSSASPVGPRRCTGSAPGSASRSCRSTPTCSAVRRGSRTRPGGGARFVVRLPEPTPVVADDTGDAS